RSEQSEADFHHHAHWHGRTVAHGGLEFPGVHRFHGFFVQTQTQGFDNASIADVALRIDHDPQHYGTLILGLASLFRVWRLRLVDRNWGHYVAPHRKRAAARSTS